MTLNAAPPPPSPVLDKMNFIHVSQPWQDSGDDWSPGIHAADGASLGCATTPLPDLPLLPPPRAGATPGSTASLRGGGGAGSLLAYRNSLGSVSEREEVGDGGGGGVAVIENEAEEDFGGLPAGEEGLEERDLFAEGGEGMQALWDSTTFGDDG